MSKDVNTAPATFKPKKSVALSGTPAGSTALCTVGHSGNDLHYRGYDIKDLAAHCEFEEVAYLLVHGKLPNAAELAAYKASLRPLRSLPAAVKQALELLPPSTHPMDVLRTGVSVLGCVLPEGESHKESGARRIADTLLACLGSMLLYWHHYARNGRRIEVERFEDSIAAHFLHLLHGTAPSEEWTRAMQTSLILYAEHEFNASTFTARVIAGTGRIIYSCIAGAIGALKGPKHGGANEVALEIQRRYQRPDEAEADMRRRVARTRGDYRLRTPGVHHQRSAQRHHQGGGARTAQKPVEIAAVQRGGADRDHHARGQAHVSESRLVQRGGVRPDGHSGGSVYAAVCHGANGGLVRARDRAAAGREDHPAVRGLHGAGEYRSLCRLRSRA